MSNDKGLIKSFFNKNLPSKEKNTEKAIKKALPPRTRQTTWGQARDTRRVEEYEKTVRGVEKVADAFTDLERAVGKLNDVDTLIDTDNYGRATDLESKRQKYEDLAGNTQERDSQKTTRLMREEAEQAELKARILKAKQEQEQTQRNIYNLQNPQPKKSEFERFDDTLNKQRNKAQKIEMAKAEMKREIEGAISRNEPDYVIEDITARWIKVVQNIR